MWMLNTRFGAGTNVLAKTLTLLSPFPVARFTAGYRIRFGCFLGCWQRRAPSRVGEVRQ